MTIVFGLARLNLPLFLLDKISRCNRANGYAEFKFFPHVAATRDAIRRPHEVSSSHWKKLAVYWKKLPVLVYSC
ncbi:hypothetical protein PVAP13_5KG299714 [Panicum virgatum]|uniref:Uncharacterized protein n=1 Tax=Panicum virgatum TaxID=38727 RepID=A0A8T0SPM8_PANVG|nr:hypothetical protein PVAP13_5KG299714 [Panicum virgatum]